ncbi:MAG: DUF5694 domain-containing protein, partial [Bacteroidota bacterium]
VDMGNIMSPERQTQLAAAVHQISQFRPTKIAFEWVTGDTLWSKHYYQAWRNGRLEDVIAEDDRFYLTSEIVQLAYPLAKAAGLDELHPIDHHGSFPLDSAMNYAATNGQEQDLHALQQGFGDAQQLMDSIAQLPITDILRTANSRFFCQQLSQMLYLKNIVALGKGDDYPGSYVVEQWYARNIRIFTNLHRMVENGDRVLVIFGAGHKEILDDLIKDRVDWHWEDAAKLLKETR